MTLMTLAIMILAMWGMSVLLRRQQRKAQAEQERRTEEALVPGNWVRTVGGFYGTVVEVDGDVVTLATPLATRPCGASGPSPPSRSPPSARPVLRWNLRTTTPSRTTVLASPSRTRPSRIPDIPPAGAGHPDRQVAIR